jgi:hypothetical protein
LFPNPADKVMKPEVYATSRVTSGIVCSLCARDALEVVDALTDWPCRSWPCSRSRRSGRYAAANSVLNSQ